MFVILLFLQRKVDLEVPMELNIMHFLNNRVLLSKAGLYEV